MALTEGVLALRLTREKAKTGDMTASLIWNDPSDLDISAEITPKSGKKEVICFFNRKACGGYLDVDMNAGHKKKNSLEPVENIFWTNPAGGKYEIKVTNFATKSHTEKPEYSKMDRAVPFRVFLNKDGKMQSFNGTVKNEKQVTAFKFNIAGDGGTGGGGNYVVFPPETKNVTFKELCAKHNIPWRIGAGFYAVARSEKIHSYKEMLLQNWKKDSFTVGESKCRKALGWPDGELKKSPKDIPDGQRLFVQSTSANRVIPAGTHVLFEVTAEEAAKHRKAQKGQTKFEDEKHTTGKKGMSAVAKAAAKAAAKSAAKAKAGPKAKASPKARAASPAPKAGAKRTASVATAKAAPKAKAARASSGGSGGGGLAAKTICFTGTLMVPRAQATAAAKAKGATVLGDVSKNLNILVAGPGAGSKLAKANALGVQVWDEPKFKKAVGL